MRKFYPCLLAAILGVAAGCAPGTPGGPGATNPTDKKLSFGQADDTFRLSPPMLATTIKQGETKVVSLGISRGKNFDEDVNVKLDDVPMGVTIEPGNAVIKHGDTETKLTIKAAKDAAVGSFTIKTTGHPAKGPDAVSDFKLTVEKK